MKKLKLFSLLTLFVNAFTIHAQHQNSNKTTESIKTEITQEFYKTLNEKSENPLLVINNFIWGNDISILNIIDPKDIKDIGVLKDKAPIELYGEKGKNGVLIIKLKDKNINTLEKFKTSYGLHNSNSTLQMISGIIYDSKKNPIPNVVISNLNRKESVKSDPNGKYSLIARENDILLFYMNGFKTKTIKTDNNKIDVELNSEISIK